MEYKKRVTKKITGKKEPRLRTKSVASVLFDRINSLLKRLTERKSKNVTKKEQSSCAICLEDKIDADQMFRIKGCKHRYCIPCMSKHVQYKLLQGINIPECPHDNCTSKLKLSSCKKFLSPELFDMMSKRLKDASIKASDKIYCPYPACSTPLSKKKFQGPIKMLSQVVTKCPKCRGVFCINCKVPWEWHKTMTCSEFGRLNSYEDKRLKCLATQNKWRQCPRCNHMVSLGSGCYHIYCRCRHEFCYICGAEWRNKKATCGCSIY